MNPNVLASRTDWVLGPNRRFHYGPPWLCRVRFRKVIIGIRFTAYEGNFTNLRSGIQIRAMCQPKLCRFSRTFVQICVAPVVVCADLQQSGPGPGAGIRNIGRLLRRDRWHVALGPRKVDRFPPRRRRGRGRSTESSRVTAALFFR